MGLAERVTYRALTDLVTRDMPELERDPEHWLQFSRAPAEYGAKIAPQPTSASAGILDFFTLLPWSSPVKYVVKSDVVAFYRHVDHARLHDELVMLGADYEATQHLIDFLTELQGRPVGLPQLHDSSDILSELYIDAVERNMLRRGYEVWRFNDDFRIACKGYMETLKSLEDLDACLREVGLTLNESKTTTPTFANYFLDVMDLQVSPSGAVVAKQEVEDVVGDYTDDFTQDADAAAVFFDKLTDEPVADQADINLKEAGPAEVRLARRALAGLARARDDRALEKIPILVRYLAELTPAAVRYLAVLRAARIARTRLATVLDELAQKTATNDWQKLWIAHGYFATGVLDLKRGREARIDWLRARAKPWSESTLRAYSTWTLALLEEVDLAEVLDVHRNCPESLGLYFADAARAVGTAGDRGRREKAFTHDLFLKKLAGAS